MNGHVWTILHHALQDVFNCMCLSEGVYKVVDFGEEKATEILGAILEGFPPGLVSLKRVEWSRSDSNQRQVLKLGGKPDHFAHVLWQPRLM